MRRFRKLVKTASRVQFGKIDFSQDNLQDKFSEIYPQLEEVLLAVIELRVTGKKTDRAIGKVLALGELIYEGETDLFPVFIERFRLSWGIIRGYLVFSLHIVGFVKSLPRVKEERANKAEAVFRRVIEIGDWVAN